MGGVPFTLVSWGRISLNFNKPVDSVTQHLTLCSVNGGLESKEGGSKGLQINKNALKGRGGKRCFIDLSKA